MGINHRGTEGTEKTKSSRGVAQQTNRGGDVIDFTTPLLLFRSSLWYLCLCGYFFFALAAGAGTQEIVLFDGETITGELASIDAEGRVTFRVEGPHSTVAEATAPSEETGTLAVAQFPRTAMAAMANAASPRLCCLIV